MFNGLDVINNLEPKNYNYIETGNNSYGFVAQDVEINHPQFVQTSTNIIPNIFEIAELNSDGIIKFENNNNININTNDFIKSLMLISIVKVENFK